MNQKDVCKRPEIDYVSSMIETIKQIALYTFISFVLAVLFNVMDGQHVKNILYFELSIICFAITVSFVVINHIFTFGDRIAEFNPLKRSLFILFDVLVCTALGLAFAQLIFYVFWGPSYYLFSEIEIFLGAFVVALIITVFAFTYFILKERIETAQQKSHIAEKEKIVLEKLKAESDLQAVQGKLNPHFLFNSLNSIASLIRFDAHKAEEMTLKLSDLFRNLIDDDVNTMHSIGHEFELIKTYLTIEKIRFGDRLSYEFKHDDHTDIQVPKLILQPLVENSIKYVISPKKKGGQIIVSSELSNKGLSLTVSDSGMGFEIDQSNGYGIQHIKDRLNLIYPNNYQIQTSKNDLFSVNILISEV